MVEDDYCKDIYVVCRGRVVGQRPLSLRRCRLLETEQPPLAALLDIKLLEEFVYPVAAWLRAIPCVFALSYESEFIPERSAVPIFAKPVDLGTAAAALLRT